MTNDKEMYLKMFRAAEQAVNLLIAAQRECEKYCISTPETELMVVPFPAESREGEEEGEKQFSKKS